MNAARAIGWILGAAIAAMACSVSSERPSPAAAKREETTLAAARRIAEPTQTLARELAPNPDGWLRVQGGATSPGLRRAEHKGFDGLSARLGETASAPIEIGVGRIERFRVRLTPMGLLPSELAIVDGHAVYEDVALATDALLTARPDRLELFFLLKDERAPHTFRFELEAARGLPFARAEANGGWVFADRDRSPVIRLLPAFAIDARARRRDVSQSFDDGVLTVSLETRGLEYPILIDPALETALWEEKQPSLAPTGRSFHGMAYDTNAKLTVLFGGETLAGPSGETWLWNGASWSLASSTGPVARSKHDLAYDEARGESVLFGGRSSSSFSIFGDTWTFDAIASSWAQKAVPGPAARFEHGMAYDAARSVTVLLGGGTNELLEETWEWDGLAWAQKVSAPFWSRNALSYHASKQYVLTFDISGAKTWAWDGTSWTTKAAAVGPVAHVGYALAYDRARDRTVLFGGQKGTGEFHDDTWEWDGAAWTQRAVSGPLARIAHRMVFDIERGRTVLFGGHTSGVYFNDTWEYHARGGACSAASQCDTPFCIDAVCCETACGPCQACDSLPSPGVCAPVLGGEDPDSCTGTSTCDAAGACKLKNGEACAAPSDCASGICAAGTCCNESCEGQCEACDVAGAEGTCVAVSGAPHPPKPPCFGGAGACDASSLSCKLGIGQPCSVDELCLSASCVDGYCCGGACTGQCEACDVAGSLGICSPVSGDPHGARPPCPGGDGVDPCTSQTCTNGACALVAGVSCRQPSCEGDDLVLAATCDGAGNCPSVAHSCLPFACDVAACKQGPCSQHGDCASGHRCNQGSCERGAICDGDHTLTLADGASRDCAPYRCTPAGECLETCGSSADCVAGNACSAAGACMPAQAPEAPDEQGCSCSAIGRTPRQPWLALAFAMLAFALSRRSARVALVALAAGCAPEPSPTSFITSSTSSALQSESVIWEKKGDTDVRYAHAMAWDPVNNAVLLYGGQRYATQLDDTKAWNGSFWNDYGVTGPGPRVYHALATHDALKRIVLFGGQSGTLPKTTHGDTWEWDGTSWTLASTTGPPARWYHSMAYDAVSQRVLLFGGASATNVRLGDTWAWDGAIWVQVASTGPEPRVAAAMADGDATQPLTLFGGCASGAYSDTFVWESGAWKLVSNVGPTARCVAGFALDTRRKKSVLFSGGGPAIFAKDTHEWNGTTWTQTASTGPGVRYSGGFAFDRSRGRMVQHGGVDEINQAHGDTWEYHARGGACALGSECDTGSCVDGVCCETPSCATCMACDTAAGPGECGPVTSAEDPDSCAGSNICDATGACQPKTGKPCTSAAECVLGFCVDGYCCDKACQGQCEACDIAGSIGTCAFVTGDPHPPRPECCCGGVSACDGAGSCGLKNGQPCSAAAACISGLCVDGVCCDSPCSGQCEACDVAGLHGKCSGVTGDPHGDRPPCPTDDPGNPCSRRSCDGSVCALVKNVPCRDAACQGDTLVLAGVCDGKGQCPEAAKSCLPFTCTSSSCVDAPCQTSADCAAGYRCEQGACVRGASCDGAHTLTLEDGSLRDCAPYTCNPDGTCRETCSSTLECSPGNGCEADGRCAPFEVREPESGGCACRSSGANAPGKDVSFAALVALLAALARRRR